MEQCSNLKISPDGRFIVKEDGAPFFWLADTAWELFHRLTREEAVEYLSVRAGQRFTVIQAVALAEFYGLTLPNAYGRTPLLKNDNGDFDPALPDTGGKYSYWDHIDFIIDAAGSLGLYVGFLPTWGDKFNAKWANGPVIFTPDNAYAYGKWIGARYKDCDNIVWIMGGDRPVENETHRLIERRMAEGIKESTGGRHLFTYHPANMEVPSEEIRDETWLDFSMIQSGHHAAHIENYKHIHNYYSMTPAKPVLDGEPRYEGSAVGATGNPSQSGELGYFDGYDARVAAYWSLLSGSCG
ncbi:MAG: DUF4038 domain-containing protein, partial [Defluviitaleaceae bacterium]|nr:DUF4038 domain-containing protein [Defluviitaleaceae bacterium]